ncbi:uncharacterized protein LOC142230985 [Haematobia irritans]|uniref:uncharacterized protein LOC142230985 n=1 Tax=Haematobia irritans TaxID=7368 RepID=UPI003F4FB9ED
MTNEELQIDESGASGSDASALKAQRTSMKRNISNLKSKIEKDGATIDPTILECRLQILESYFRQISHIQTQIEKLNTSDNGRGDIEELYIGAKTTILKKLNPIRRSSEFESSFLNTTSQGISHHNRLPQLKLPKFDGKYSEYYRFINTFNTLVNDDGSIPIIDKFNYLLNCLSGQALAVVEPFQVVEENYSRALERLKARYDNKPLIFIETINNLFTIVPMSKPNAVGLRSIVDTVAAIRGSLLTLGQESDIVNAMLIHIVLSKIDTESKTVYNEKQDFSKLPSWDDCYSILSRRCQFLESCNSNVQTNIDREAKGKQRDRRSGTSLVVSSAPCEYCQAKDHFVGSCPSFLALPVSRRFDFAKSSALCINCLRKGHIVAKCQSKSRCKSCNFSHHSTLHNPFSQPNSENKTTSNIITQRHLSANSSPFQAPVLAQEVKSGQQPSSSKTHSSSSVHFTTHSSLITRAFRRNILPTAIVLIKDKFGIYQPARALLDSCSEINLITEESVNRLRLSRTKTNQEISGVSDIRTQLKHFVSTTIKSRTSNFEWTSDFFVTKSISSLQPSEHMNIKHWNIPQEIELADPQFYLPQRIDLLISADVFFDLLLDGKIYLGDGLPYLVNTALGWVVGGKIDLQNPIRTRTCNMTTMYDSLDTLLKAFWEVEEFKQNAILLTDEEKLCEEFFVENSIFDESGRVKVRLPFKQNVEKLGSSFDMAYRRFQYLEKRLSKDPLLKTQYVDFMNEYLELGHMSLVHNSTLENPHYVIPHHPVLRPQSISTKLRVVFDASARTSSNVSLNETLQVGPTIQQDLVITLLVFRMYKYALSADICKMYRQFLVDERDRNFQLILWRKNSHEPLNLYQLNTVTYGTSAAPFLAVRSLHFIADAYKDEFPIGANVLKNYLYVDDILTGADDIFSLSKKKAETIQILEKAGLKLSKWNSNCPVLTHGSEEIQLKINDNHIAKALGMSWKPRTDVFCFRFEIPPIQCPTKRSVLSAISKIFDVFGLLGPIIVSCKILIQEMWKKQMDWDSPLTETLMERWFQIQNSLPHINQIEIPRYLHITTHSSFDIHGFADASQLAYGCCLYVRVQENNIFKTQLLIAKSKVAPVKQQSVPRLELMAALLLSRTWDKIKHKFDYYTYRIYFWTDSKIVLNWLMNHSSSYACFVANRISEIQNITNKIPWNHVPSKQNAADIISRGCLANELNSTVWFTGPDFLQKQESEWPSIKDISVELPHEELRKISLKTTIVIESEIQKLICQQSSQPTISANELQQAFWRIVHDIQRTSYIDEINSIRAGKDVQPHLQKLSPFIQEMQNWKTTIPVIRVGGRLANAALPYDTKFPALLPNNHRFTNLYAEYLHRKHLHAGPKALLGILRQHVWVVNGRDLVRKVVRRCVHCFKFKPRLLQQVMGNLPSDRFMAHRPFLVSGVDFCGPFYTSYRIRGKPPYKTYVAIFVCFSSKAVHIELVSDLSTNTFILCLKRFIGRRGIPLRLYCDNATNFVGANAKLKEFKQRYFDDDNIKSIENFSALTGFQFSFIPPRSPHFGGLWESAVKSTKTLLVKNMSQAGLTYEELQTVLIEVEAILNSRPLAPRSDDPNDGEAISPAHLLIGSSLLALPDENIGACPNVNYLKRWQMVTYLKQQFWQQWLRDYVLTLQQKSKWYKTYDSIEEGRLVIVHEDNIPPQHWLLARIVKSIPGRDGKVRVVDLKTTKGIFRRSIHKIAPLPTTEEY